MSAERWIRVKRISDAAESLPEADRHAYIRGQCGADEALLKEVLDLLTPEETHTGNAMDPYFHELAPGTRVGNFLILEAIGRGGMGQVYLAEQQQPFKRKVALKILSAPSERPGFANRFLAERQILATLEHEYIARIYDGGVIDEAGPRQGCPFFTLEYVDGSRLDTFCAEHRLSIRERLELFPKVCQAVGYAHSKQIIHRDLKPGNIMVTRDGKPKLLDFGIAKALDLVEFGQGLETETGGPRMLTPHYAAPEQLQRQPVSPATDIYALGVVFYQLLTGHYPYVVEDATSFGLERAIREQEPERPADVILRKGAVRTPRGVTEALAAESLCRERRTNPERLRQFLSGDLERILLKMLAKDPADRYDRIDALIHDLDAAREDIQIYEERPEPKLDALIWYHADDRAAARLLADHLREDHGLKVGLEHDPLDEAAGERLAVRILESRSCLICLGPGPEPPWRRNPEVRDVLVYEASRGFVKPLPVLLPGTPWPEKQSRLPPFLRGLPWFVMDDAFSTDATASLVQEIRGRGPALIDGAVQCPYRGLEAFREEHRHLFFGREAVVQRLLRYLNHNRFLALLGPSGSGKSSVVRAGLIPLLRESGHGVVIFSPGSRPLEEAAFALHKLFRRLEVDHPVTEIRHGFGADRDLSWWAQQWCGDRDGRLTLVIDQFEETFTLTTEPAERNAFINLLVRAMDQAEARVSVLITMRSDFLGKCALHADLNHYINDHFLQLGPMSRVELGRAISEPAKVAELELEPGLQEAVLDEVLGSEGELPLLEHALLELYQRRRGKLLTLQAYREIGGIAGALVRRAETEYEQLDLEDRETLRKMFVLFLVFPGDNTEDTRRRAALKEILGAAPDAARAESLLQRLVQARLLTAFHDERRDEDMVEVAHEVLIRGWERIRVWMDRDRQTVRAVNRLRGETLAWLEAGRDEDLLPRGGHLFQLGDLAQREAATLGESERQFVAAGFEAHEVARRRAEAQADNLRRRRNQAVIGGALSLVLAAAAFLLFFQARRSAGEARQAEDLALQRAKEAEYNLAVAFNERVDQALADDDPRAAWIYALNALTRDIPEDRDLSGAVGRFYNPRLAEAGRLVWSSPVQPDVVTTAVSVRGLVAAATTEHDIRLLDMATGERHGLLLGHTDQIRGLAFSPDGNLLASCGDDGVIHLWDTRSEPLDEPMAKLRPESWQDPVTALCFSPDGHALAALSGVSAAVWSLRPEGKTTKPRPKLQTILTAPGQTPARDLSFSADGSALWVAGAGLTQLPLDRAGGAMALPLEPSVPVTAFVRAGDRWFLGGEDGVIRVIQAGTGTSLGQLEGHGREITVLRVDGDTLLSGSLDGAVRKWDTHLLKAKPDQAVLTQPGEPIFALALYQPTWNKEDTHRSGKGTPTGPKKGGPKKGDTHLSGAPKKGDTHNLAPGPKKGDTHLSGVPKKGDAHNLEPEGPKKGDTHNLAPGPKKGDTHLSGEGTPAPPEKEDTHQSGEGKGDTRLSRGLKKGDTHNLEPENGPKKGDTHNLEPENGPKKGDTHNLEPEGPKKGEGGKKGDTHNLEPENGPKKGDTHNLAPGPKKGDTHLSEPDKGDTHLSGEGTPAPPEKEDTHQSGEGKGDTRLSRGLKKGDTHNLEPEKGDTHLSGGGTPAPPEKEDTYQSGEGKGDTRLSRGLKKGDTHNLEPENGLKKGDTHNLEPGKGDTRLSRGLKKGDTHNLEPRSAGSVLEPEPLLFLVAGRELKAVSTGDGGDRVAFSGHPLYVDCVAFSSNGQILATGSGDRTLRLWRTETGEEVAVLRGHGGRVTATAFSPTQDLLASGSEDGTVRLWRGQDSASVTVLEGHEGRIAGLAFSPDGASLAVACWDNKVHLWSVDKAQKIRVLEGHDSRVQAVAFAPDGGTLASVGWDRTLRLWDLNSTAPPRVLRGHQEAVLDVAYSPKGDVVVTVSGDKTTRLWDPLGQKDTRILQGHDDWLFAVAVSPDGATIATGGKDQTTRLWDAATGVEKAVLGHQSEWAHSTPIIRDLAFHPDGGLLASVSEDKRVRLWAVASEPVPTVQQARDEVRGLSISPDQSTLAFAGTDRLIHRLDLTTGRRLADLAGHQFVILALAHSPDGQYLVSAGLKEALIWNLNTGESQRLSRSNTWVGALDFHPTEGWFGLPTDNDIALVSVKDGKELGRLQGHTGQTLALAVSPDGTKAVSSAKDRTAIIWDLGTRQPLQVLSGHTNRIYDAVFSPDGGLIATVSADQTVRLWDTATGASLVKLNGHKGAVFGCAFSPEGDRLATVSNDRTVRLWSVPDGQSVAVLQGHQDEVIDVVFWRDGKHFFSSGDDARVRFWRASRVLAAPPGWDTFAWREELLRRVYHGFGYRRDGFRLTPVPKCRFKGANGYTFLKVHPYRYLDQPRPLEQSPAQWFRGTNR